MLFVTCDSIVCQAALSHHWSWLFALVRTFVLRYFNFCLDDRLRHTIVLKESRKLHTHASERNKRKRLIRLRFNGTRFFVCFIRIVTRLFYFIFYLLFELREWCPTEQTQRVERKYSVCLMTLHARRPTVSTAAAR